MGIVDKVSEKLPGNKHNQPNQTYDTTAGPHSSTATGLHAGNGLNNDNNNNPSTNSSGGLTGNHHTGLSGTNHNPNSGIAGGTAVQHTDFLPGSHPSASNPSAVPTAGGARVGQGTSGPYDNGVYGAHDDRSGMEKVKDKVVPSRSDRPDDPITGQNYGQNTTSAVSGHHNQSGLTGSHGTSAATPLAHDSSFNDRHTGPSLTGNTHSGSNTHAGHGIAGQGTHLGGHDQYAAGGVDNRSGMEKMKDKVVPSRTDRPDDPISGQNYGQTPGSGNHATNAPGGPHIPGTAHGGQTGNQTYGTGAGGIGSNQFHGTTVGGVGQTGVHGNTPDAGSDGYSATHGPTTATTHHTTTTAGKPSLMDKLNPKIDADGDGKAGFLK